MLRDKYPIPIHTIESQLHGIRQLTKGPSQFKSLTKSIRELSREREREREEPKAFISQHVRQFHSPNPSFPSKKKKILRIMFLSLVKMIPSWLIHLDIYIKYIAL